MARWLGTPYATTVRHLVRLKIIDRSTETVWLKYSPGSLKGELAGGVPLGAQAHVHVLTPAAHAATVHVTADDCLLLAVPGARYDQLPAGLTSTPPDTAGQLSLLLATAAPEEGRAAWVTQELTVGSTVSATTGSTELFRVNLRRTPGREGSDHFWA
jgi:hypothetical protein